MIPHRDTLLKARKVYSQCANKVEKSIAAQGLTPLLSTQVIGIGVATEWVRRAAEMDNIHYMGKNLNKSKSNDLFIELLRFNFSWFALNAIFTRNELLSLFGTPSDKSEYSAFCLLYTHAVPQNATVSLQKLHRLLNTPITTRLPSTSNHSVSTLEAIYLKYLPNNIRGRTAKAMQQAIEARNANSIDMPTLLYGFRNWSVHGNTLHGCFGSHPGFLEYASLLQETLADVHYGTARKLMSLL
ncbi:hypothetical protein QUA41_28530 [Microcoleus sp. Pol11C1]|uniref:hypothetical protein n=1 Tax=unclassified Microcoleus TaxID=2642155 RepID=UPI002FD750AA